MTVPPFLYHVTRASNLASIREHGLQASRHGEVHGGMDVRPPRPAVYLSRKPHSDNLHADLFDGSPLVVLRIDMAALDTEEMWPDDFVYDRVAEGELLGTVGAVRKALGCDAATARRVFEAMESATDETMPEALKPFWSWYLNHSEGGEIAYTADIPPAAILAAQGYTVVEIGGDPPADALPREEDEPGACSPPGP